MATLASIGGTPSPAERIEIIGDEDCFSRLPKECILQIFGYLSAVGQAKCGEVSRRWKRLAFDETLLAAFNPRNLSPLLKIFDESDWVTYVDMSAYGITTEDIPPYNARKTTTLLERVLFSPLMTEIERNAGITFLTIPKGLTFNTLVKLAASPKVGNIPKFKYICGLISSRIGNIAVDKTYRIVITNNVFNKSRNLCRGDQKALVNKTGCEMPKVLEATLLCVVTRMVSGERHDDPPTYTRCWEQFYNDNPWSNMRYSDLSYDYKLQVSCFSPDRISVDSTNFDNATSSCGASGVLSSFRPYPISGWTYISWG